jgi:hypothetical protein
MAVNGISLNQDAIESLHQFHLAHFKDQRVPSIKSGPSVMYHEDLDAATTTNEYEASFYTDGARRTLSDDQIAMFRHSEIQRLLLAREQRREQEEKDRKRRLRRQQRDAARGQRLRDETDTEQQTVPQVDTLMYDDDTPAIGSLPDGEKKFMWPALGAQR